MNQQVHPADVEALHRCGAVEPAWIGIVSAGEAVGLQAFDVVHCGPPFKPGQRPPQPILNSAYAAAIFEGWARDAQEAQILVQEGRLRFLSAQPMRLALPMAAVATASMPLIEIGDLGDSSYRAYSTINGGGHGGSAAPRFGRFDDESVKYLRFLNHDVAAMLEAAITDPVPWLEMVDLALTEGDDVHLHHVSANRQLHALLRQRAGAAHADALDFVAKWHFFHLNFWMAAVRCVLAAGEGVPQASLVTGFGGNGLEFGVRIAGQPDRWHCTAATPPQGNVREPCGPDDGLGAFGDSALVEAFGLGAMAHSYCHTMRELHADFAPPDWRVLPELLLGAEHPFFNRSRARFGLLGRQVIQNRTTPIVELGIVDASGRHGGLGAGIYRPPLALFESALSQLS